MVQKSPQVQSDQYIPAEDIHGEMAQLEKQLDEMEQKGVELEKQLRDSPNGITFLLHRVHFLSFFVFIQIYLKAFISFCSDEDEERLLVDWFTLIHDKHLLVRREAELVYT